MPTGLQEKSYLLQSEMGVKHLAIYKLKNDKGKLTVVASLGT